MPLSFLFLYVLIYYFTHFTILTLLEKAKKAFKNNKVMDIGSFSAKNISEGFFPSKLPLFYLIILNFLAKKKIHDLDTYDIRKNLIYLPLIEELESFKIIQPNESPRSTLTKRFLERHSTATLKAQTFPETTKDVEETFYENYWDFKVFRDFNNNNSIDERNSDKIEITDEHRNFIEDVHKTTSSKEKTNENLSNQFLKNHNEEDHPEEYTDKIEHNLMEDPKILEFLGEKESKNIDPSSRSSMNSAPEMSPLKSFSLLKHSLMHNIYKPPSILKLKPVLMESEPSKEESKMEDSKDFTKMFQNQEKKISEIRRKDTFLNISPTSSRMLSSLQSPEKKPQNMDTLLENESLNNNYRSSMMPKRKMSFFFKSGQEILNCSKPTLIVSGSEEIINQSPIKVFFSVTF